MSHSIVNQLLVLAIAWFFLVFGIIGVAVGIAIIFYPVRMQQVSAIMNHWVSLRRSTRWLAIPRGTKWVDHRYRQLLGVVLILVAIFSTSSLIAQSEVDRVVVALGANVPHSFAAWIVVSVRWFLIGGGIVAVAVGIMLVVFPNALRAIETRANHWHSPRNAIRGGDTMNMAFDRKVESYPRSMGWFIAAAALVVVVDNWIRLFAHG